MSRFPVIQGATPAEISDNHSNRLIAKLRCSFCHAGDHAQRALDELHVCPGAKTASRVAIDLEDAQRAVLRLRERLLAEERSDDR